MRLRNLLLETFSYEIAEPSGHSCFQTFGWYPPPLNHGDGQWEIPIVYKKSILENIIGGSPKPWVFHAKIF